MNANLTTLGAGIDWGAVDLDQMEQQAAAAQPAQAPQQQDTGDDIFDSMDCSTLDMLEQGMTV